MRDGVDGLWFRPGDAVQLSEKMEAALDPALWDRLVSGIASPRTMPESAKDHVALYQTVMAEAAARADGAAPKLMAVAG